MEEYGADKISLLRDFLPYKYGIPSDNTLSRFFSASGKSALHTVTAFASEARLVLAQVATDKKSNELTAIPKLLDLLGLKGAVVSIDAAGCQRDIARKIVEGGGDDVPALKGNQGALHECAKALFDSAKSFADICEEDDKGHGRTEVRRCEVLPAEDVAFLREAVGWPALRSVARVTATRTVNGKTSVETRYDVSSLPPDAKRIAKAVRSHWAIENSLHWTRGGAFNEDASRIRKENAPFAMTVTRHIALNLIQIAKRKGEAVLRLRKKAARCDVTLKIILNAGNS